MVDPKETQERTVGTEADPNEAGRRPWVMPRLETVSIVADTEHEFGHKTNDGVTASIS